MMALAPMLTGATNALFDPDKGIFADEGLELAKPSVTLQVMVPALILAALKLTSASPPERKVIGLGAGSKSALLDFHKIANAHTIFSDGARSQSGSRD